MLVEVMIDLALVGFVKDLLVRVLSKFCAIL